MHNITLSPLAETDAYDIVHYMRDEEISLYTKRIPFPYSYADAKRWLEGNRTYEEEYRIHRNYAIRDEGGRMLGCIGIHFSEGIGAEKSEFGYWLGKPHWNKGIMTQAIALFCELAKEKFKMKTLVAHVFAFNIPSQRALLKSGFIQTAFLPAWYKKDDRIIDALKFVRDL